MQIANIVAIAAPIVPSNRIKIPFNTIFETKLNICNFEFKLEKPAASNNIPPALPIGFTIPDPRRKRNIVLISV